MANTVIKLLLILLLQQYLSLYDFVESQQMFQQDPVPDPFELDDRYPNRDEFEECRPIKLQLERIPLVDLVQQSYRTPTLTSTLPTRMHR